MATRNDKALDPRAAGGDMTSPVGTSHTAATDARAQQSEAYRAARDEYRQIEELRKRHPIAAHLRERRLELRLTQDEVARAAGTSYSAISRLEKGTFLPKLSTLQRIARVLDEELQVCFTRDGDGEVEHEHALVA